MSRTLRISFDTPLPYYPYAEPEDVPRQSGRELQVWLVSSELLAPLAGARTSAGWGLRRPWSEGAQSEVSDANLSSALGADLAALVPGARHLQTFGDWKEERPGFGDLVLVPAVPQACDAACVEARRPLLALLDPSLRGATPVDAASLVVPAPTERGAGSTLGAASSLGAATTNALSCALGRHGAGSLAWLVVLGGASLAALRRRWHWVLLALAIAALPLACGRETPLPASPPASGPAMAAPNGSRAPLTIAESGEEPPPAALVAYAVPADPAERQKSFMRLLAGYHGEKVIPTWSTPLDRGMGRARSTPPPALRDIESVEKRCLPDENLEGIVSYRVEPGANGAAARARVRGPFPASVLACLERELAQSVRIGESRVDEGWLSLGSITPEVRALRQSIAQSKLVSGVAGTAGTRVTSTATTTSAGLSKEIVQRVLRRRFAQFRGCYEQSPQALPKGKVTVRFTIQPDGSVGATAATTADVAFATGVCVGNAVRSERFPNPDGGQSVKVSYTLGFERGK